MHRCHPTHLALGLLIALVLAGAVVPAAHSIRAMQAVPTPEGQLGGPMPLPSESEVPNAVVTATPAASVMCDAEPLTVEEVVIAVEAPISPSPEPSAQEPATAEQVAAAEIAIVRLIACANRNEPARLYALFTQAGIARSLQRQAVTSQTVPLLLSTTGEPLPLVAQAQLVSIERVLATGNDRLRVEFAVLERNGIGEFQIQRYAAELVNADDTWLIDDVRAL